MSDLLTTREAAELLKLKRDTLERMCRDGRIEAVRVSRFWRVERCEVMRLIEEGRRGRRAS